MKVLMHICCGPCTIYPLKALREEGIDVAGYFFNPNIHPYSEFSKRLETLKNYARVALLPLTIDDEYDLVTFLRGTLDKGPDRCLFCYAHRLKRTFARGRNGGLDAVTTTLLYSKYQNHEAIKATGDRLSKQFGLPFLYRDFRTGWKEGVDLSKNLNMYRQAYCGCIFSERERFRGR
jgi:predicted adenine nucleotide alpha hydrolase (AANH) superfamily ATPase